MMLYAMMPHLIIHKAICDFRICLLAVCLVLALSSDIPGVDLLDTHSAYSSLTNVKRGSNPSYSSGKGI